MVSGSSSYEHLLTDNPERAGAIRDIAAAIAVNRRLVTLAFALPEREALWELFGGLQAERYPGSNEVALKAHLLDSDTPEVTVDGRTVYDYGDGVYLHFEGDIVYFVFAHDLAWLEAGVESLPD